MLAQWGRDDLGIGFPYHLMRSITDGVLNTVNALERNPNKRKIEEALKASGMADKLSIVYDRNYDSGCYHAGPVEPRDENK
jgi:hypothetical protein